MTHAWRLQPKTPVLLLASLVLLLGIAACSRSTHAPRGEASAKPKFTSVPATVPPRTPTSEVMEEDTYRSRVSAILLAYSDAFNVLDQFRQDPSLRSNPEFRQRLELALITARKNYDRLDALAPPVAYQTAHTQLLAAATEFRTGADLVESGITANDLKLITEADAKFLTGSLALSQAQQQLKNLPSPTP